MLGFKDYARVSERKMIMVIKQIKTYIEHFFSANEINNTLINQASKICRNKEKVGSKKCNCGLHTLETLCCSHWRDRDAAICSWILSTLLSQDSWYCCQHE